MTTLPKYRTVIRHPRYEVAADAIYGEVQRADEAVRGLEWVICRQPQWGYAVPGRGRDFGCWVSHGEGLSARVIYRYTDEAVLFLAIDRIPPPGDRY